ncbi:MAG: co-chaperone GroES [Planctomycetes bacterium]|nr:co-chaperone GroES [Planctomycetota bacterium]
MKLQALGDRVVVERLSAEEKTSGGIVLPDTAKEKPKQGKVISVGTGRRLQDGTLVPLTLDKGDRVIFRSYAGDEVKLNGKELLIMREDDVLAKVDE